LAKLFFLISNDQEQVSIV